MIGLVVVSHSAPLAAAAVELALQMAGDAPPRIEVAAGTADGGLGTDATAIAGAIERAGGADGVLVLMDLGSAILSAEMAVEFLAPGTRVLLSPAPFVEGLVAAVVGAASGASLDAVAGQVEGAWEAKRRHLGAAEVTPSVAGPAAPASDGTRAFEAVIRNPSGLHARPAAAFVRAAARHHADVRVADLDAGGDAVSGESLLALMALGVRPGTRVRVSASGPHAPDALAELQALIEDGFGETDLTGAG